MGLPREISRGPTKHRYEHQHAGNRRVLLEVVYLSHRGSVRASGDRVAVAPIEVLAPDAGVLAR